MAVSALTCFPIENASWRFGILCDLGLYTPVKKRKEKRKTLTNIQSSSSLGRLRHDTRRGLVKWPGRPSLLGILASVFMEDVQITSGLYVTHISSHCDAQKKIVDRTGLAGWASYGAVIIIPKISKKIQKLYIKLGIFGEHNCAIWW